MSFQGRMKQSHLTIRIVWMALLLVQFIFPLILYSIHQGEGPESLAEAMKNLVELPLFLPLNFVAVLSLLLSIFLPSVILRANLKNIGEDPLTALRKMTKEYGKPLYTEAELGGMAQWPLEDQLIFCRSNYYFVSQIIRAAITETIGIFGLIMGMQVHYPLVTVLYVMVSVALFTTFYPGTFETYLERLKGLK